MPGGQRAIAWQPDSRLNAARLPKAAGFKYFPGGGVLVRQGCGRARRFTDGLDGWQTGTPQAVLDSVELRLFFLG